jgi:hypothetical protein
MNPEIQFGGVFNRALVDAAVHPNPEGDAHVMSVMQKGQEQMPWEGGDVICAFPVEPDHIGSATKIGEGMQEVVADVAVIAAFPHTEYRILPGGDHRIARLATLVLEDQHRK